MFEHMNDLGGLTTFNLVSLERMHIGLDVQELGVSHFIRDEALSRNTSCWIRHSEAIVG